MSKLTSQEVIDRGDYLEPEFDPSTLLVVHLRAILQNHDVKYAANATKAQLIKLFNQYVVPNAGRYKQARRDTAAIKSDASDIVDGSTGEYLEPSSIRRRLSRKSTAEIPKRVASASPTRKSRRLTATPRASTKPVKNEEEVATSDDERMAASVPTLKENRRKSRRISHKWGTGDQSSMWEDNNPFQQAASSTPDLRESATKSGKQRGRYSDFTSPAPEHNIFPVAGSLNLPAFPMSPHRSSPLASPIRTPAKSELSSGAYEDRGDETFDENSALNGYPYVEGDSQTEIIRQKIASLSEDASSSDIVRKRATAGLQVWFRLILSVIFVAGSSLVWTYKADSAALGYCDAGKATNPIVLRHLDEIQAAEDCRASIVHRADAGLPPDPDLDSCKMSLLPRATKCTPCPPHAVCSVHSIVCEPAYVLRQNPLSLIPFADVLLNGLPGLGPVALPPRCVADVRRRQNVGRMARAIENKLASTRGDRVCAGIRSTGGDAQDAAAYGMSVDEIRTSLTNRIPKGIQNIDDIFDQAVSELKDSGLLVSVRDITGKQHFAAIREELNYICRLKLFALKTWTAWRNTVLSVLFVAVAFLALRSKQARKITESRRVKNLVKEALERVKEQEARHYLDPSGYPSATLSSLQLRDEIMQEEHSISTRARLWQQVEKIVESNSNIRSNVEVTPAGDEGRVWTWVGAGGRRTLNDANSTGRHLM